jgi:hypothetical protein
MAETVKFDEPEGFVPPENLDADDTFQAMATFKVLPSNQLQLIDIEGYDVGGEGGMEEEEQEPGAGEAAPTTPPPGAPAGGGPGGGAPNMSEDQLAPGANQTRTQGYAERLGQMFKKATAKRR